MYMNDLFDMNGRFSVTNFCAASAFILWVCIKNDMMIVGDRETPLTLPYSFYRLDIPMDEDISVLHSGVDEFL